MHDTFIIIIFLYGCFFVVVVFSLQNLSLAFFSPLHVLSCLVPVRRPPRPSRLIYLGDVSEANGWEKPGKAWLKNSLGPRDLKCIGHNNEA